MIHIVTSCIFPAPGGLEASCLRIARVLSQPFNSRVIIYTRRQPSHFTHSHPAHEGLEVVHLAAEKAFLVEPLSGDMPSSLQVDYLLLRARIEEKICAYPGARHILISFSATRSGFTAQQVAHTLGIPHVASIRGSDFSRDFRSPHAWQAIQFVVERAEATVTTNREQARTLAAAFPVARQLRTIHNAMPREVVHPLWTAPASSTIRLVSDCGFSYKKATHVLLRAVSELLAEGIQISLTVAGNIAATEEGFWKDCKQEYATRFPGSYCFPGWLSGEDVTARLLASHIYVSASLGEGCSLSRIRALTLGMPMAVTKCGALSELAADAGHVRLCQAGSVHGLTQQLRSMIADTGRSALVVDQNRIREWREYFSPARERAEWEELLAGV